MILRISRENKGVFATSNLEMANELEILSAVSREAASIDWALARVLDGLEDAILLLDRDWRIVYANQSARRLSRIKPESLNRETLWQLYPEIVDTALERAYRDVVEFSEERKLDAFYYEPFQTWFEIRILPMEKGVAVCYRDVTAVHEAEIARDESAEQLRQVMEATSDGILSLDRDWRITYLNRRAEQLLAPIGDLVGTKVWESFPAKVYQGSPYVEHYYRTMTERTPTQFEAFYPDPLNAWFEVIVRPAADGLVLFFRDVTERRRRDEERRESEARLKAIYSGTFEYIGLISPDGIILDCNRASLEFGGNTREELIGLPLWESPWFVNTEGAPELLKRAVARAAAGEFIRYEAPLNRPSGETVTFDFSLHPIRNAHGKVVYIVPEGRDITELKRAQTALLQTEKLAVVGRMASSIAHEINNPLAGVTNLVYLARQEAGVPVEAQRYLDSADQELRRVSMIASQTLQFPKQGNRPQLVSCSDLFSSVLAMYEGRLRNSHISVDSRHFSNDKLLCFPGEIRQVLSNLVGNAIEAMPEGGRMVIQSRTAIDWKAGRKGISLTVADTGCGIDPQVQAKVFEPFFTTKGTSGTGLGLWVSAEIVRRHHGYMSIHSSQREGRSGTVMRLFLPAEMPKNRSVDAFGCVGLN
jgi:PAS domain S-box-containing protein